RIAHQTGRSAFAGLDGHDLPAFTGGCRYQIADGVRATQAGHVTTFLVAIEMSELELVRDRAGPHVLRETLPERDEPGTQLVTRTQMLQGSQHLLVLSHVEELGTVHRPLASGRSDAARHACVVLPRGSRTEPVELLEQPLGLSRLDCNGGFGKLEAQLGHDLRAGNALPAVRRNLAFCLLSSRARAYRRRPRMRAGRRQYSMSDGERKQSPCPSRLCGCAARTRTLTT